MFKSFETCFSKNINKWLTRSICTVPAVVVTLYAGDSQATTFDFSIDEFGIGSTFADDTSRIFSTAGAIITLDGLQFLVTARETNSSGVSQGIENSALFIPNLDLPSPIGSGSATDDDLDPLGIAFDTTVIGSLNGVLDPDPIGPFGSGMEGENSLVVQNPTTSTFINDFAPSGSNLGVLEFELLTPNPAVLERVTFIDDVDARVFTSTNPGTDFIGPGGTEIGDIQINGAGSVPMGQPNCDVGGGTTTGDNCVGGLRFTDIVIEQGESFIVAFDGSGGVLGFEVTEIPLPASAYMVISAFGLLGWVGWRRRNAAT